MNAIDLLHKRVSAPVLLEPAPTSEQLEVMFRAALRAPDHGALSPWRCLVIEGEAREKLGDVFVKAMAAKEGELADDKRLKLTKMPLRAPTIVVVIASPQEHPKVPESEQVLTAGCAAHAMTLAAYAQGLGAIWRTGELAFDTTVKCELGLEIHEHLVGFIYLGTPMKFRELADVEYQHKVKKWGSE